MSYHHKRQRTGSWKVLRVGVAKGNRHDNIVKTQIAVHLFEVLYLIGQNQIVGSGIGSNANRIIALFG